jgi:hypothetical protein
MPFVPSPYSSYGAPDSALLEQFAPAIEVLAEQLTDETRQAAVIEARVQNLRDLIKNSPDFLKPALRRRLNVQKAKLEAAQRSVSLEREQESARRTWRALGQIGVVAGILLVGAGTVRVLR